MGAGTELARLAGEPQSKGRVARVQQTILEECWKPAFARHLIPKYTGLWRHLDCHDFARPHTGCWNRGRTPGDLLGKAKCCD